MRTVRHGGTPCTTTEQDGPAVAATAGRADLPCWTADPELFFAESPASVEAAKALCARCPVRQRCLAEAIRREEPWGVWGGELFDRGVVVPRKRPRGRPRNADLARDAAWHAEHDLTSVA